MLNLISRLSTLVWKAKNFHTFQESKDADFDLAPDGSRTKDWNEATLVLSKHSDLKFSDLHWPVLDLDMPCHLIPSTHEGHFHLVIEHPMSWEQYVKLLKALRDASLLEPWFVNKSIERGYTAIRRPGILKKEVTK